MTIVNVDGIAYEVINGLDEFDKHVRRIDGDGRLVRWTDCGDLWQCSTRDYFSLCTSEMERQTAAINISMHVN